MRHPVAGMKDFSVFLNVLKTNPQLKQDKPCENGAFEKLVHTNVTPDLLPAVNAILILNTYCATSGMNGFLVFFNELKTNPQ